MASVEKGNVGEDTPVWVPKVSTKVHSSGGFTETLPRLEIPSRKPKLGPTSPSETRSSAKPLMGSVSYHTLSKILGDDVAIASVTHRTLDLIPSRLPRHFSLLSLLSYTFGLFLTTGFVQLTFNIYTFHQKDEFHSTFSLLAPLCLPALQTLVFLRARCKDFHDSLLSSVSGKPHP